MRRTGLLFVGILALAIVAFASGPVIAGDYHQGATLICSDCHTMHSSQQHGYNANGTGIFTPIGGTGPYHYLLRNHINDLCLSCHDGQTFAPDVLEANTGTTVRQAGALNRDGTAPYYNSTGHTLDSTDTPPGGTWTPDPVDGLLCTDCHYPHGGRSGQNPYRNLSQSPGNGGGITAPTYAVATNDTTKDVFERNAPASYDIADIDFNEPDQTKSAYATYCKGCHTDFHGAIGGAELGGTGTPPEEFVRHPTAGVDIGALGGGHSSKSMFAYGSRTNATTKLNWVKVMTATENWEPNVDTDVTDHTPSCFTCHKGHGNQNAFGLVYMNALSGAKTEEGTSGGTYRNLCNQCHAQGT